MGTVVEEGSGNVFLDVGFPRAEAEELQVKSDLTWRITSLIREKKLSRADAAAVLGTDPPKVSKLMHGSALKEFSYERLMRFLTRLGQDVQVVTRSRKRGPGHVEVLHAEN